jgi:glycosyltransferase involved in cell wall biosynthesis
VKHKILHIINSFEYGGAETMLCNLMGRADRDRFVPVVAALIDDMRTAGPVLDAGIAVHVIGMRPGVPNPRGVMRLAGLLRRERPAVVQTWMDHSNLIGALAVGLSQVRAPLVWGVHHACHMPGLSKRSTLWTVAACARLSGRVPRWVVCCSEASRVAYASHGFASERLKVIPNGFDTQTFRPDPEARSQVRRELGLAPDVTLIGLIARYDPFKDHDNFLRAAAIVAREAPEVRFLLCGVGVDRSNDVLAAAVRSLGLGNRCHLLGPRRDVARVMAALDLAVSSSRAEAFPLAVGEAMACGVPCVVTDVGDSAAIVGATGWVVPPRDPHALAAACRSAFGISPSARIQRGMEARRRICEQFDLTGIVRRYEELHESLIESRQNGEVPEITEAALSVRKGLL